MPLELKNFLSRTRAEGLAKTSKYEVLVLPPPSLSVSGTNLQLVSLFAEIAELPSLAVKTNRLKVYGPAYQRVYGIDYGEAMNITFLLDRQLKIKTFFEDWIFSTVSNTNYNVAYQNRYVSQGIKIRQLDSMSQVVYQNTLVDAFPISISALDLNSAADEYHRMTVTFGYRKWEREIFNTKAIRPSTIYDPITNIYAAIEDGVKGLFAPSQMEQDRINSQLG